MIPSRFIIFYRQLELPKDQPDVLVQVSVAELQLGKEAVPAKAPVPQLRFIA